MPVAIKAVLLGYIASGEVESEFVREVAINNALRNINIVQLYGTSIDRASETLFMVMGAHAGLSTSHGPLHTFEGGISYKLDFYLFLALHAQS
jgi:serine/threonine protein kinase